MHTQTVCTGPPFRGLVARLFNTYIHCDNSYHSNHLSPHCHYTLNAQFYIDPICLHCLQHDWMASFVETCICLMFFLNNFSTWHKIWERTCLSQFHRVLREVGLLCVVKWWDYSFHGFAHDVAFLCSVLSILKYFTMFCRSGYASNMQE